MPSPSGTLALSDLLAALHAKCPRDMRRRVIPPEKHVMGEVVGISSGSPPTTSKHWSATGEIPADTRDRERNKRKGAECRERLPERDTRIPPTEAERAAVEELREITESEGMRRVAYARNACENLERASGQYGQS